MFARMDGLERPSARHSHLPTLRAVPAAATAPLYAQQARRAIGEHADAAPLPDLDGFCAAAGVAVARLPLRAAAGGIEATLTPLDGDRFGVVVDPEPAGGWQRIDVRLRADLARHRYRFRLAHELAHTLFYDRSGARPRRRFSVTAAEEAFCDRYARALLLPDDALADRMVTPAEVLRVQREYDVSLELCVRAFADVHGRGFFGLLVANGPSAPVLRPQWVSATGLPARWWTTDWVQRALSYSANTDRSGVLGSGRNALRCLWRALPHRGQVLITAGAP
jgi:hypothetical protein